MRLAAIAALIDLVGPVDKIVLAMEYNIRDWLLPSLKELAVRPEPISPDEASRMGFETAWKLVSVRERVVSKSKQGHNHYSSDGLALRGRADGIDLVSELRNIFDL